MNPTIVGKIGIETAARIGSTGVSRKTLAHEARKTRMVYESRGWPRSSAVKNS
jgi:hypothetical protein